jgi:hypothetical protein
MTCTAEFGGCHSVLPDLGISIPYKPGNMHGAPNSCTRKIRTPILVHAIYFPIQLSRTCIIDAMYDSINDYRVTNSLALDLRAFLLSYLA